MPGIVKSGKDCRGEKGREESGKECAIFRPVVYIFIAELFSTNNIYNSFLLYGCTVVGKRRENGEVCR